MLNMGDLENQAFAGMPQNAWMANPQLQGENLPFPIYFKI